MRCLTFAMLLCVASPLSADERFGENKPATAEEQRLLDKWIVRSVQIDGKPTPAQIGQKAGDVITINRKGNGFFLS